METNVNYTIVGAFVITILTGIILAIIWLSSGFSFEQYNSYMVYMQESVTGLSINSTVEYNGVQVGMVNKISINQQNPRQVEVLLSIKNDTPITQGTVATLTSRGITGISFISLKDNSSNLQPLVALPGQKYPVIKTAPSIFMRLDTALNLLTANFSKIGNALEKLLNPENQQSIQEILINLKEITGTLALNNQRLNAILENTARASQQLMPLINSSNSAMRMLETQTLPSAYRTMNNLDDVSRSLAEISAEIKQNPSILIRGKATPTLGPGEGK
jgi:phospholipid/cholesterol/gamma-HCH transport system substrate-binding protein